MAAYLITAKQPSSQANARGYIVLSVQTKDEQFCRPWANLGGTLTEMIKKEDTLM